jgi:hypothetical protein
MECIVRRVCKSERSNYAWSVVMAVEPGRMAFCFSDLCLT